jgi:hypothetical protein
VPPNWEIDADPTATVDEKGRPLPVVMTDREILEELLTSQRKVADLVNGFFADLKGGKINPMSMMMGVLKR